jgi:hypothetical protein
MSQSRMGIHGVLQGELYLICNTNVNTIRPSSSSLKDCGHDRKDIVKSVEEISQ